MVRKKKNHGLTLRMIQEGSIKIVFIKRLKMIKDNHL